MYQVNVIYNKDIVKIIFNCISIDEASKIRYREINRWFSKKMQEGIEPAEIYELLEVEIAEEENN